MQGGHGKLAGRPGRLWYRGKLEAVAPPSRWRCELRRRWLPGAVAIVSGPRGSRGTSLVHGSTTEPEVGHALGQRIRYDATSGVQMQVHLHKSTEVAIGTRATAPGESPSSIRRRQKDTQVAGVLPQKVMNGGSDAKRRAAVTAESREMAQKPSQ